MTEAARPGRRATDQLDTAQADMIELRVGLAGMAQELAGVRQALAPLAGMPQQLDSLAQLQAERLTNHIANHIRDVAELHADIAAEAARRAADDDAEAGRRRSADEAVELRLSKRMDGIQEWQTWAMRLVLGLVIAAVVGVVLVQP